MNDESVTLVGELDAVGTRGYSAYEIAVQNGFVGTEEEWLESLKGETGEQGEQGEQGSQGIKGDTGATPQLRIGEVETLEPGEASYINIIGTPEYPIFNMGLPQGIQGIQGIQGERGLQGIQGETGETPNFTAGNIVTLNPGESAYISITGTPENPVLNMGIPQGPKGDQGIQGIQGPIGLQGNTGPQGPKGDQGIQGIQGPIGLQGEQGVSIVDIVKKSTVGLVDTYEIQLSDGQKPTFTVTNGEDGIDGEVTVYQLDRVKSIANVLPKVEGEGTDFTLEDTADGVPLELKIEGNTSQESTTGIQLFDINDVSNGYFTSDAGNINSALNSFHSNNYIDVESNSVIYLRFEALDNLRLGRSWIQEYDENKNSISRSSFGIYDTVFTKEQIRKYTKTLNENTKYIRLSCYSLQQLVEDRYVTLSPLKSEWDTYIKLTLSFTDVDNYEPYTGGQPSPNPDYPQPIKVVTGEQNVEISGKNLYTNENATYSSTYITPIDKNGFQIVGGNAWSRLITKRITVKKNTDYVFKLSYSIGKPYIRVNNTEGNAIVECYMVDYPNGITFNSGDNDFNNILIYPTGNSSSYNGIEINLKNIQIEEGSQATEYEPYYTPQTYPLSLGNIELFRNYTDKTKIYTDYIFKNEIGSPYYNSSLDENSWYKYNRNKKIELKNYNYTSSVTKRTNTILFLGAVTGKAHSRYYCNILSNYHYNTLINSDIEGIGHGGGYANRLYISVNKNRLEGYTEDLTNAQLNTLLKQFLESNNAYAWYALSTPTYEKIIDTTLIQQLENINNKTVSVAGKTIVNCTSVSDDNESIQVNASTYLDLNTVLNRVATLETEV